MAQRMDSEVNKKKIAAAKQMARKGQYQKARFVLKDIQQHPEAKAILRKIEGRDEKRDLPGLAFSNTIWAMIGGVVIVLAAIAFSVVTFQGQQETRTDLNAQAAELGFENTALYVNLVGYCRNATNGNEACIDWAQSAYGSDENIVIAQCVFIESDNFTVTDNNRQAIMDCLTEIGIPLPS